MADPLRPPRDPRVLGSRRLCRPGHAPAAPCGGAPPPPAAEAPVVAPTPGSGRGSGREPCSALRRPRRLPEPPRARPWAREPPRLRRQLLRVRLGTRRRRRAAAPSTIATAPTRAGWVESRGARPGPAVRGDQRAPVSGRDAGSTSAADARARRPERTLLRSSREPDGRLTRAHGAERRLAGCRVVGSDRLRPRLRTSADLGSPACQPRRVRRCRSRRMRGRGAQASTRVRSGTGAREPRASRSGRLGRGAGASAGALAASWRRGTTARAGRSRGSLRPLVLLAGSIGGGSVAAGAPP